MLTARHHRQGTRALGTGSRSSATRTPSIRPTRTSYRPLQRSSLQAGIEHRRSSGCGSHPDALHWRKAECANNTPTSLGRCDECAGPGNALPRNAVRQPGFVLGVYPLKARLLIAPLSCARRAEIDSALRLDPPPPPYQSAALLDAQYYSQCLQTLIEHVEALMSAGLGLAPSLAVELDLDGLFRMDAEAPGTGGRHAGQTVRPGRYSRDLLRRQSRPASQVA